MVVAAVVNTNCENIILTVRQVGNIQRYSVQCVLVINMFNEKIFVLLWFWFMILTVCTIFSFLYWFILLTFPCFSRWFISHSLELSEMKFDPDNKPNKRGILPPFCCCDVLKEVNKNAKSYSTWKLLPVRIRMICPDPYKRKLTAQLCKFSCKPAHVGLELPLLGFWL
uniref:Innexin n=1 Tax=Parascaris equorum TaxID=6256 RepID=A0A914RI43_PAREQ